MIILLILCWALAHAIVEAAAETGRQTSAGARRAGSAAAGRARAAKQAAGSRMRESGSRPARAALAAGTALGAGARAGAAGARGVGRGLSLLGRALREGASRGWARGRARGEEKAEAIRRRRESSRSRGQGSRTGESESRGASRARESESPAGQEARVGESCTRERVYVTATSTASDPSRGERPGESRGREDSHSGESESASPGESRGEIPRESRGGESTERESAHGSESDSWAVRTDRAIGAFFGRCQFSCGDVRCPDLCTEKMSRCPECGHDNEARGGNAGSCWCKHCLCRDLTAADRDDDPREPISGHIEIDHDRMTPAGGDGPAASHDPTHPEPRQIESSTTNRGEIVMSTATLNSETPTYEAAAANAGNFVDAGTELMERAARVSADADTLATAAQGMHSSLAAANADSVTMDAAARLVEAAHAYGTWSTGGAAAAETVKAAAEDLVAALSAQQSVDAAIKDRGGDVADTSFHAA